MLTTLVDRSEGAPLPLSPALAERHGGPLRFPARSDRPRVIANFVTTLDGVVSYRLPGRSDAALISGKNPDDRFLMGLLRAIADAVVVGAGTLREERRHVWTPRHIFPDAAGEYAALRERLGKPALPATVFVSASGEIDLSLPAFRMPALRVLVLTTARGAAALGRGAPEHVAVRALGDRERLDMRAVLRAVAVETGASLILSEGGPQLIAALLAERVLDELFLTVAPQLAGRDVAKPRLALVEGKAFAPEEAPWGRLVSAKVAADFLFLRYALASRDGGAAPS